MKFLNGWIDIPDEDLEKDTDEEVRVCQYCQANPNECGEWEECCYNGVIREMQRFCEAEQDEQGKVDGTKVEWEQKIMYF